MRRALALVIVALVMVSALGPAVAAVGVGDGSQLDVANESTNETDEVAEDAPTAAETVRLTPVALEEEYLAVEVVDAEAEYETRGPFALFVASEALDSVRIAQSAADATMLEGERTILVEYDDEAAPEEDDVYFELELYFLDGSDTAVDLYASETDVSVEAAKLTEYAGLIDQMEQDAQAEGYESDPEGVEAYYDWQRERVELLENYLVEYAMGLVGLAFAAARNPLAWLLGLTTIAVLAYRRESSLGWILDRIENDAGEAHRKERELVTRFEQNILTADEEPLTALEAIGPQQAAYWKDTFGVTSVRQLAELAHSGRQVRADGGQLDDPHDGVRDLHPEELRESWLEPILRSHRLSSPREALGHMRAALIRMDSKYGMGFRYRETRATTEELLAETGPGSVTVGDR